MNPSPNQPSSAPSAAPPSPFQLLGLEPRLLAALAAEGYVEPTPIQAQAIPPLLARRDLLGCAQTGTGKTAAFLLPILQHLAGTPRTGSVRALVLAPTRELAAQIAERASAYGQRTGIKHAIIYGGVGQTPQEDALRRGPDLLIATPGRLLDLIGQGYARLDGVEILVLDEADRMLDMGFLPAVRRVVSYVPTKRQTLLFSATMPRDIQDLARSLLVQPVQVSVAPKAVTADTVAQELYLVPRVSKRALLEKLLRSPEVLRSVVFTRTKHGANRLAEQLTKSGIEAAAIHGNKSQGARERALGGFRDGTLPVLVATDLASRGIDVDGVTHVFNYELPNVAETYVHRIGRTGRAGAEGKAVSLVEPEERTLLADIERLLGRRIPSVPLPELPPVTNPEPRDPRDERALHPGARPGPRGGGRPQGRQSQQGQQGRQGGHSSSQAPRPAQGHDARSGAPKPSGPRPAGRSTIPNEGAAGPNRPRPRSGWGRGSR